MGFCRPLKEVFLGLNSSDSPSIRSDVSMRAVLRAGEKNTPSYGG